MTKLNDARRQLLEAAAANEDGFIDIPKDAKAAARALIKAGLLIATPQDGAEGRCLITTEGRAAVAPAEKVAGRKKAKTTPPVASEPAPAPAPAKLNKTELMVHLLTRPEGASIVAMSEATGWRLSPGQATPSRVSSSWRQPLTGRGSCVRIRFSDFGPSSEGRFQGGAASRARPAAVA